MSEIKTLNITEKQRKTLRILLMLSVIVSLYFGLQGLFIDLYNPGSQTARQYHDVVNIVFVASIILSVPLLIEKYNRFTTWNKTMNQLSSEERGKAFTKAIMPIIKQAGIAIVIFIIASILIAHAWELPADVIANYKAYYQTSDSIIKNP
jgi:hypothetical protein